MPILRKLAGFFEDNIKLKLVEIRLTIFCHVQPKATILVPRLHMEFGERTSIPCVSHDIPPWRL